MQRNHLRCGLIFFVCYSSQLVLRALESAEDAEKPLLQITFAHCLAHLMRPWTLYSSCKCFKLPVSGFDQHAVGRHPLAGHLFAVIVRLMAKSMVLRLCNKRSAKLRIHSVCELLALPVFHQYDRNHPAHRAVVQQFVQHGGLEALCSLVLVKPRDVKTRGDIVILHSQLLLLLSKLLLVPGVTKAFVEMKAPESLDVALEKEHAIRLRRKTSASSHVDEKSESGKKKTRRIEFPEYEEASEENELYFAELLDAKRPLAERVICAAIQQFRHPLSAVVIKTSSGVLLQNAFSAIYGGKSESRAALHVAQLMMNVLRGALPTAVCAQIWPGDDDAHCFDTRTKDGSAQALMIATNLVRVGHGAAFSSCMEPTLKSLAFFHHDEIGEHGARLLTALCDVPDCVRRVVNPRVRIRVPQTPMRNAGNGVVRTQQESLGPRDDFKSKKALSPKDAIRWVEVCPLAVCVTLSHHPTERVRHFGTRLLMTVIAKAGLAGELPPEVVRDVVVPEQYKPAVRAWIALPPEQKAEHPLTFVYETQGPLFEQVLRLIREWHWRENPDATDLVRTQKAVPEPGNPYTEGVCESANVVVCCFVKCGKEQPNGPVKFKFCSRCKFAKYCSKECQAAAWPTHKLHCKDAKQS
jgi:hypothetical protein